MARYKINQDIHVAFWPKITPKSRAKNCQALNMVAPAKIRDFVFSYYNAFVHVLFPDHVYGLS